MKVQHIAVPALALVLAGCTTSSQVQEIIDQTHRDYLEQSGAHEASIEVLKQSSMAALERSKKNSESIAALSVDMQEVLERIKVVQGYADASKVMSAANTVKVSDFEHELEVFRETLETTHARMLEVDAIQEEVAIRHYQSIVDAACRAIDTLKANGLGATNQVSATLEDPIEIIAPDTSAAPVAE